MVKIYDAPVCILFYAFKVFGCFGLFSWQRMRDKSVTFSHLVILFELRSSVVDKLYISIVQNVELVVVVFGTCYV
jgi:hypothetical protein